MALNELDQSLLGSESLASLDESNLSASTDLNSTDQTSSPDNVTKNLLVQSLGPDQGVSGPGDGLGTNMVKVPKNVSAGNPILRASSQGATYANMDDFFLKNQKQLLQNPLYLSGAGSPKYATAKQVEKMDDQDYGYIYGVDNDDMYGKMESSWSTVGKAIPRLVIGTVDKVVQGFGFLGGLVYGGIAKGFGAYEGENVIDIASDNAMMNTINQFDDWTKNEWLPTFQEAADREKGFWARAYSDLDFWTDDFVDGASFLAAAWIPGAILGEAGAGAAMAARLGRAAESLGVIGDVSASMEEASALTRWFAETGKAARNLDAFNSWAIATSSEAMFEASGVRKDILNSPDYDANGDAVINPTTGRPFTLDEKKKLASEGAMNTFLMNATILSVSNLWEYKQFSKLFGKASAKVETGLITGAAELGQEATVKAATPLWQLYATKALTGTAIEGFYEENMQLAIQRYNTQYGQQGQIGSFFNMNTWGDMLKQYGKQTYDAVLGNDKEAAANIGIGGLIGSLFGGGMAHYQRNKEQKYAQGVMAAFNNGQNSYLKFGDVFQYETVDATDKDGNPIKTKKIVLDGNGKPVYDYDKIIGIATGFKLNSEMFDQSFKEWSKDRQELLRMRSWVDFVGAHFNAGLEKTLMAKLDKLETAKPEDLAKLGFVKDENFKTELERYKRITAEVIKQNKAITDVVLFRNTSFFDKKNAVDNNRRAKLVEIIGNNVVNKEMANKISDDLQNLKSQLLTDDHTHLSDGLVEQLNNSLYRIKSQEAAIAEMKKNGDDKILPMSVFEKVLQNLKSDHEQLLKDNETSVKELSKNADGSYRFNKEARNDEGLTSQLQDRANRIAELKNEMLNSTNLFSFFADRFKGRDNFTTYYNAVVAAEVKKAETEITKQKEKKAQDEAAAKFKAETEHKVIRETDGTFTIVDPNGVVIEEGIVEENQAKQKAGLLTMELMNKKQAEQQAKEEEERKKQQQQQRQQRTQPKTLAEKKDELVQKENRANELLEKGANESRERLQELINQGKTEEEAASITEEEWRKTPDGQEYVKLTNEIDDLEKEIAADEAAGVAPTLEKFLSDIYENIRDNEPDFKISYDDWLNSGRANASIKEYNKKYNKNEKEIKVPGTSTRTGTTAPSSIEEEIDTLDIENAKFDDFLIFTKIIRQIYQKINGDKALLQRLIDKINQCKDDALKKSLSSLVTIKVTSSDYVPLESVGISVNIEEHVGYDMISMPMSEFSTGFTLNGDKAIIEKLAAVQGDATDRVTAVATVEYIKKNQERLAQANIPNRTMITNETPKDIAKLNQGLSVIAKAQKSDGFHIQLFLKDGTTTNIYVAGIGSYAIVHPDNTTEKITWSEEQREFIMNNMLIDKQKMTNEQYDSLRDMYNKMQAFEEIVLPQLQEHLKYYAFTNSMDITHMFQDVFTVSSFSARKREPFEDVLKRAGRDRLFTVMVADENNVVKEMNLPLMAYKRGSAWEFEFPLKSNERLVTVNESGEVESVLDFDDYIKNELGLNLEMTDAFPGGLAWISKDVNEERGYSPLKLDRVKGTETPGLFRNFSKTLTDLQKAIKEGLASQDGLFKFDGTTYSTLADLLVAFNKNYFSFFQYNGYVANIMYNPNSKVGGKVTGKFLIELRPQNYEERNNLDSTEKRALNVYIDTDDITSITDSMTDAEVGDVQQKWMAKFTKDIFNTIEKLRKSKNPKLAAIGEGIKEELIFDYSTKNNQKSYRLKLIDKQRFEQRALPNYVYDAREINVKNDPNKEPSVKLAFNDSAPTLTATRSPLATQATVSQDQGTDPTNGTTPSREIIDSIEPEDNDAPFLLDETEDNYEKYTEGSFNTEVEWLRTALANSGVTLEDLGTIINNLAAKKNVLGYYKNKAIYVSESLSKKGTIYHEAFHALFRDILTQKQRNFYLEKMKGKVGYITNKEVENFRNERGYFNKTDDEIRDLIYEEHLAEGFRRMKLEQKQPKEGWFKKFLAIFDRIINFFTSKRDEIDQLYEDFDAGRYANINRGEASTISKEGAYALAYGRPKLIIKDGATGFTIDNTQILNIGLQNELMYKLLNGVAVQTEGTFNEKFNNAIEKIKADYNIEKLIKDSTDPITNGNAIRAKYGERFNDALFVLGENVPYVLSDELQGASDAMSHRTREGANKKSLDVIKKEVEDKLKSLGLDKGFDADNIQIDENDEDYEERSKGGDFDTIHMNPLEGLSKEFRSLFSTIPYEYVDDQLGVTVKKMADGKMLFDAMIKIAANTPLNQVLPSLSKAVAMMKEDGTRTALQLEAFENFIKKQFGISDLSDPNARPSKNIYLYKQFIDVFFVTELQSKQVVVTTRTDGSTADVYDASINADMAQKKADIKLHYEQAYRRLNTEEAKKEFEENFQKLKTYILNTLMKSISQPSIVNARSTDLKKIVNTTKQLLDNVNIILPKNLIRQSILAIYNLEKGLEFTPQSKQNRLDMEADQRLMKEGAYLQSDFWTDLAVVSPDNYENLFADTKEGYKDLGSDFERIRQLNAIVKKAMKYVIKYDVNSAIPTFMNAENEKIWRYSRYTPPILLAQLVREGGIDAINDFYPILREWYGDNPLFDGSAENELFLENLQLSAFGGFRQEIDDDARAGSTFGSIDSKALLLSNIVHFMNRDTIKKKMKGVKDEVSIVTFDRSRTQEEATTTNFLVTARYQKLINKDGSTNATMVNFLTQMLKQEYNRIQREWSNRENPAVVRYNGYNLNVHPETNQPITGDSYTTKDGKVVKLRAYQFENFKHFFDQQKTTNANQQVRTTIKDTLRDLARMGVSFEEAINEVLPDQADDSALTIADFLIKGSKEEPSQFEKYMDETFQVYVDALKKYGIITGEENDIKSDLIPSVIKQDFGKDKPIQDYGYEGILNLLKDQHLNVFMNKMQVNQIFDGDIATGIKSAVEYYKRNKSGVISGNSMKFGTFRTAVIQDLVADINPEDLTQYQKDVTDETTKTEKIADGQAYHVMNHRIRMMDAWGRVDSEVRQILNAAKYRRLTVDEIQKLEDKKIVLNTLKTATGGVLEYYKLSEHLISRTEVSHLVLQPGQTVEDAYKALDDLYSQIETLEDSVVLSQDENSAENENKIKELYNEVHKYWEPKRSRAKLHYMLNSMELSGIDMLFDTNASKKTTLAPVKLKDNDLTDLTASKSSTSGLFKFMQVETSGVKDRIRLPTQARQLLTTYINKLTTKAYNNKSLAQLAAEYAETLGKITDINTKALDARILDKDGNVKITELYEMMSEGLRQQGADANTLKFFEIKNGKPVYNPNMPEIKKIFTYYYFSMFNNSVFGERVSGRSDVLVSSYGHEVLYDSETGEIITGKMQEENPDMYKSERYKTRALGVNVETINGKNVYTIEVIIPEILSKNESEKQLFLEKLNQFFSTRIPTEDKRSMIVCKVVDYMEASYRNSIVVPQLVHILAGSDLDVDKLYSHTFDYYIDFNDEAHVYGDYSNFATPSQGRFVEYINYMMYNNAAIKDSVAAEVESVSEKPVFTADFIKLKDELGLSDMTYTAEELKEKRKDIAVIIDVLKKQTKELQIRQNTLFDNHIAANARAGSKLNNDWLAARQEYFAAKQMLDEKFEELDAVQKEQKRLDNTIRLAALVNVLKSMNMPTTQSALTKYIGENGNPVVAILQNQSLQQKMDILSNEEVFNNFYIKEKSSTEPFSNIAESIGASVQDVVIENSIYSIMGDMVANQLNSSNKDGIGIEASFNKFLAFAEKNDLTLTDDLFGTVASEMTANEFGISQTTGEFKQHNNFLNTDGIRNIGAQLGMFADAAKDPIPSVLNLNPETAGPSNLLIAMSGNIQLGILMNKLPFIEEITNEVSDSKSAAQTKDTQNEFKSTASLLKERIIIPGIDDLSYKERLAEIFQKDKDGEIIMNAMLPMFIETKEPANIVEMKKNKETIKIEDLGFIVRYADGAIVADDVAKIYLASVYRNALNINSDTIKLGRILNLIKDQNPDFNQLDNMLADFDYFMSGESVFGKSIVKVLASSAEYLPLVEAARKLSDYSKQLLIERTPLFKSINNILLTSFSGAKNQKARQNISDQITKLIIIQKSKVELEKEIKNLQSKTDEKSLKKLALLENASKYFTADYWINNNTFVDDLDYLYNTNPGNPFVEFLKVNTYNNITLLEGSTRMKLDKDIAENINNGYEALQKSGDLKTMMLSRQMYYYLLLKDGLGYSNNSFLSYISPDLGQYQETSSYLDQFQNLLADQQKFIDLQNAEIGKILRSGLKDNEKEAKIKEIADKVYKNYLDLFDNFFGSETPGKIDWINLMVRKIFSNSQNQNYIREYRGSYIKMRNEVRAYINEIIKKGVFSSYDSSEKATGDYFDFTDAAGSSITIDFNSLKDSRLPEEFDSAFGNIFVASRDLELKLRKVNFPMLIRNVDGRLFKLMAIDDKSVSEDIAFQSITGIYKGTGGLKAQYREIEVEGTRKILNFGFTQTDAVELNKHSQPKDYSEENEMMAMGIYDSNISDNQSALSIEQQLEIQRRKNQAMQDQGAISTGDAQTDDIFRAARERINKQKEQTEQQDTGEGLSFSAEEDDSWAQDLLSNARKNIQEQGTPKQKEEESTDWAQEALMAARKNIQQQAGAAQTEQTLTLQPDNIAQVKAGTKTITNRTEYFKDGQYKLPDGTLVNISFIGEYKYSPTTDSVQPTDPFGGARPYNKDDYARKEGFKDWADFENNNKYSTNFINGTQSRYIYSIQPVVETQANDSALTPPTTSTRTIDYTPKGKPTQTYTIEGNRILNKNGDEVFKEDSVDRNKIFANLAVKEGRAVVVDYRGIKYVVNNKGQIISGSTGKVMQWGERNGDRQAVLALANQARVQVNAPMSDPNAITDAEIADIYKSKIETLKAQNLPVESLDQFAARAKKLVDNLKKMNMPKDQIIDSLTCL